MMQKETALTAYFSSKQLPLFAFATRMWDEVNEDMNKDISTLYFSMGVRSVANVRSAPR